MDVFEKYFIWFLSFLVFLLLLVVAYKISYKLGIKKALYRTTYIVLSVVFAFVFTPLINAKLFHMDLSKINIEFTYKDETFHTLVDYIEEVVAHSDFLNDIYNYFPSLKDLFMDFPEVILAPLTYVLLFIVFVIVWTPLYLYLSYKRKRRILYDRGDKKGFRVWAGVIGSVQCFFLISIVLTPLNGFNRIYHAAIEETLDDEYHSLCKEISSLEKYSKVCDLIDVYNSTIFANVGGKGSLNNYVFDSLTRIYYDGGYTNIAKESSLIMKSSIVLDQSGLFDYISEGKDILPLEIIMNNNLSEDDIDLIVDTIGNSKYSENLLYEMSDLIVNTLDSLLEEFLGYHNISIDYSMNNEEFLREIKVCLKAVRLLGKSNLLAQIMDARDVVVNFVEYFPEYKIDDITAFEFVVNLVNTIDLEVFEVFCDHLFESKIFNKSIPYIIDKFLGAFGFSFVSTEGDVLDQLYNFLDYAKLMKKYQPIDFFDLVNKSNDEDLLLLAELFIYVSNSPETRAFIDFVFSNMFIDFDVYAMSDIYGVKDWTKEVYVVKEFCGLMRKYREKDEVDTIEMLGFLGSNSSSEFAKIAKNIIQRNLDYFIKAIILGEDLI